MRKTWFGIMAVAAVGMLALGCSSPSTPTDPGTDVQQPVGGGEIEVKASVHVSQDTAAPGDRLTISATVGAVRAEDLRFSWVNMTERGKLIGETQGSVNGPFSIDWKAPSSLDEGSLNVEALHLVVTAISRVISVDEEGSRSSFDVSTWSEMIPITISTEE